ncbi:hypothetical protein VTP01DRAFT_8972 [Rhizomucor pusillus]|uniref:uncharacterized protein n=1 Tax=Rhizomucor pusillus TaxID=4840 RepID=UPI0037433EF5
MTQIVVFGAGVIGLTTAILLKRHGYQDITIVGKHHPGDKPTHEYTSPWAGASIVSFAAENKLLQEVDQISFQEFKRQAESVPESGVMYCPGIHLSEVDDPAHEAWSKKLYQDTVVLSTSELPKGVKFGYKFLSFTLSAPKYLEWLTKVARDELGIKLERGNFASIQQVAEKYPDARAIINCTGLGSRYLQDVKDQTVYPVRGQTVLVHAPHIKTQMYREGPTVYTYIIPRPDGNVICGGTLDSKNTNTEPDHNVTKDILKRVYDLYPELTHHKGPEAFNIVSENVGFRPVRTVGPRIELEKKEYNGRSVNIIHNYGHGPHGYQSSWGSAAKVLELLEDRADALKAKL